MATKVHRVYLDNSSLCRPFDDASQERVRLEAEAVGTLADWLAEGRLVLLASAMNRLECEATPDEWKRRRVQSWLRRATRMVESSDAISERQAELMLLGFKEGDAFHVAAAESAAADVLLSCDDRLVRLAGRLGSAVRVRVAYPQAWLLENSDG